jgi:hypothetical protein
MSEVFETIEGPMGVMVKLGLGKPSSRGLCSAAVAAMLAYTFKFPRTSFRQDGTMKPFKPLSAAPDATTAHFLLIPMAAGTFCYLFT